MINIFPSQLIVPVKRKLQSVQPIWIILSVTLILATLISDRFLTTNNLINVMHHGVIVGIVALGMTLVLILGHFDLSTGAIVMMAAVFSIEIGPVTPTLTILAIILPVLAGTIVGLFNGFIICGLGANSIIATLGVQFTIFGGVLAGVSGAHVRVDAETELFHSLANGYFFAIPNSVFVFFGLALICALVMHSTIFGRHIYAIGGNRDAAIRAGINTTKTGIYTFMISGGFAAVSGVLIASRVRHLDPTGIAGYEFPALTAAVLGGASLMGGEGRPLDTVAAILVITIIGNVMILSGLPHSSQLFAQGIILALAVAYHEYRRRGGK
ncbi:MAG: hypothetical protein COB90_05335 [Hyphomicrobiales bacterium]|nr:MAG: hypothetical protein COB90_05335 [Hyphomicrobiales bacterium]